MADVSNDLLGKMAAAMATADHFASMTNAELVAACCESKAADYQVVIEMMNRLDPTWADEKPNMRIAR